MLRCEEWHGLNSQSIRAGARGSGLRVILAIPLLSFESIDARLYTLPRLDVLDLNIIDNPEDRRGFSNETTRNRQLTSLPVECNKE